MPEVILVEKLRSLHADDMTIRRVLTFNVAMDRARDADRLAVAGARLCVEHPWAFDPDEVARRSLRELTDALRAFSVSQRHMVDAYGWRMLGETLSDPELSPHARAAIAGAADARELLEELGRTTPAGTPLFPLLGGPKVGPLWVRLLAYPGEAKVTSLDVVPVAVDVQVRKVTEYLGVTNTGDRPLEDSREAIQQTWFADVAAHGADGPGQLGNTAAALDPALWF